MKKRIMSLVLALVMCMGLAVPAFASNVSTTDGATICLTTEEFLESENYQEISREEYIATKAQREGITYAQAEAIVDESIANAKASLPSLANWEDDTVIPNHDSTYTVYGRVYNILSHESGMQAIGEVQAVIVGSHYGRTWASCDAEGIAYPYGDGAYSFDGSCTANLISTTQLRMTISGYFEIAEDVAYSSSISLDSLTFCGSVGGTNHYRTNVYKAYVEKLTQST